MNWPESLNEFLKILDGLNRDWKIWLIHHADADGCVSAVYINAVLKKIGLSIERRLWVPSPEYDLRRQKSLVEKFSPDVLIFLDLDVVSDGVLLGDWKDKVKRVLIYDHHKVDSSDLICLLSERKDISYLNPRLCKLARSFPASFFGYQLWKILSGNEIPHWLLGVGLIGDRALEEDQRLKEFILTDYQKQMCDSANKDTKLEQITRLLNSGYFHSEALKEDLSFQLSWKAFEFNQPKLFFDSELELAKKLQKRRDEIEVERIKFIDLAKKDMLREPSYFLSSYLLSSANYISGLIASGLTNLLPAYVVLVGQPWDSNYSFEIRKGSRCKLDLTEILRRQKNYFKPISAGGHPSACGALIRREDLDIFLTTFRKALSQLLFGGETSQSD